MALKVPSPQESAQFAVQGIDPNSARGQRMITSAQPVAAAATVVPEAVTSTVTQPEAQAQELDRSVSTTTIEDAARNTNQTTTESAPVTDTAVPITTFMEQQVLNPQLAAGTEFTPTLQTVQQQEVLQAPPAVQAQPITASIIAAPEVITPTQVGAAPVVSAEEVTAGLEAQQVTPTITTAVDPAIAAQIAIQEEATVRGQLTSLFADVESGEVPSWARVAYNQAQEQLNATGLQASSISAGAITLAMMQAALPIAAQDAQAYYGAQMQNATFEQQTELENLKNRQQNMLTDVAIQNASEQFNASSIQQTQQFVSTLISNIQTANANRVAQVETFNVQQKNLVAAENVKNKVAVDTTNAQISLQVQEFNSKIGADLDKFNSEMRFAIDQSNVLWRRSINTANTAAVNAANQANVQNRFNLSVAAQNNIWQEYRDDDAYWKGASQNQIDREYNLSIISGNRDYYSGINDFEAARAAGNFAIDAVAAML